MSGLGPHGGFILASYAAVVVILGGLIAKIRHDHRVQSRILADYEQRGVGRRADRAP
jgi:heme exporter protein D